MELSNKFEKMEIKSVRFKLNSKKKAGIMSMKNLMDKETETDGKPSAMRSLHPSLQSKREIINISSDDSDYLDPSKREIINISSDHSDCQDQ